MNPYRAFADELEKIAISQGRWTIPKTRSGRRSMSVDTLLRKEKDGTLTKQADLQERTQRVRELREAPGSEAHEAKMQRWLGRLAERRGEEGPPLSNCVVGKLAAAATEQANAVYQEYDPKNTTITPPTKFRRGDVPAREDIPGRTGAEYRPDVSGSTASRGLAPEGYSGY